MTESNKWNEHFMSVARLAATWSKDPSTKVGAAIVNPVTRHIKATGYNGLPRGAAETQERTSPPAKYKYTVHAELNAILACDIRPVDHVLYCTLAPCVPCAAAIIQAGIKDVYVDASTYKGRYSDEVADAQALLEEAGISYRVLGALTFIAPEPEPVNGLSPELCEISKALAKAFVKKMYKSESTPPLRAHDYCTPEGIDPEKIQKAMAEMRAAKAKPEPPKFGTPEAVKTVRA